MIKTKKGIGILSGVVILGEFLSITGELHITNLCVISTLVKPDLVYKIHDADILDVYVICNLVQGIAYETGNQKCSCIGRIRYCDQFAGPIVAMII